MPDLHFMFTMLPFLSTSLNLNFIHILEIASYNTDHVSPQRGLSRIGFKGPLQLIAFLVLLYSLEFSLRTKTPVDEDEERLKEIPVRSMHHCIS